MFKFGDKVDVIGYDNIIIFDNAIFLGEKMYAVDCPRVADVAIKRTFPILNEEDGYGILTYNISQLCKSENYNITPKDAISLRPPAIKENTADQIAKLIDTDKPIDERIIDFCEKLCNKVGTVNIQNQDSLFAACSNVLDYYKSIDDKEQKTEIQPTKEQTTITVKAKFGGEHEAKLAEQKSTAFRESFLKQPAVYLPDTIFTNDFKVNVVASTPEENNDQTPKESKRKPNKLRRLIKKIVKTEIKKQLKKAENE